jgi:HlyD family secretion protein
MKDNFFKRNRKKIIRVLVIVVIVVIVSRVIMQRVIANRTSATTAIMNTETVKPEVRDIQNVLSSSGIIEPLNTYVVKTLVEGEVIASDFEEGDYVEEGQILYQIATDNLDSKIESAETAVKRAEKDYAKVMNKYQDAAEDLQEAKEDYQEALIKFGNTRITAEDAGIIKTLFVEPGDSIQKGSQIAELYDNTTMVLEIPFNASEVSQALVGKKAEITISDSFESLEGKVTNVSSLKETLTGNRLVKKVTIEVNNPGGINDQTKATAAIGQLFSSEEGFFRVKVNTIITSKVSGEIAELNLKTGSKLKVGDIILTLTENSVEDLLASYNKALENAQDIVENTQDSVENAKEAIEDAQSNLQEVIDNKTDYNIKAPISGRIIRKDALVGDTINNASSLCTIYDLSSVKFSMYVDELDVMKVVVGQGVDVTADAYADAKITGIVTNISLESSANNGVTQYPVTVQISNVGKLLPGMNVTGEIIIEKVEGVLAIPSDALMRGDQVYVADASVTEAVNDVPVGYRAVKVETGITDGNFIEIKSGLTGEEELYVVRISSGDGMVNMPFGMGGGQAVEFEQSGDMSTGSRPMGNGKSQGPRVR